MVLALYFLVVIVVPAALGIYVALHGMHRSASCPCCADETIRLRSRIYSLVSLPLSSTDVQLRWCLGCGWRGTARVRRESPAPTRRRVAPDRSPDRVDIRRLDIDGHSWKVMVQCWAEGGRWVGRLLFVGPDGRACTDDDSTLQGGSAIEVLSTALSIPEQTLAGRIRRAIH